MKIVSFIPIKLNNQRLPGKNLLPLCGKVMCEYIFETIKQVELIEEKYVFCSDESIKKYIPKGLMLLKRDKFLDGFQIKGLEIIEEFVKVIDADIYVLTHVTQPFTKASSITLALKKVIEEGYDSAFSVMEVRDYCWFRGKPLNYNMQDIVITQNLEPIYKETGAFFIFRKEVFAKYRQRIGKKPFMYIVDQFEAIDIDDANDYAFAKMAADFIWNSGNRG